jgi:hypothetical protein
LTERVRKSYFIISIFFFISHLYSLSCKSGDYAERKSFIICTLGPTREGKADSTVNFKHTLESVYMKDLKVWIQMNLTENQAVKRALKLAG